jgi:hypothetical protein
MGSIGSNLQEVKGRIAARLPRGTSSPAAPAASVTLLAVSKTFGADAVREAHAAGQRAFGENYVQEALAKIAALADLRPAMQWHLIGPLQSNKTRVWPRPSTGCTGRPAEDRAAPGRAAPGLAAAAAAVPAGQRQRRSQQERRARRPTARAGRAVAALPRERVRCAG